MENQDIFDRQVDHLIRTRMFTEELQNKVSSMSEGHRRSLLNIFRTGRPSEIRLEVNRYVEEMKSSIRGGMTDYLGAEISFQKSTAQRSVGSFYSLQDVDRGKVANRLLNQPITFSQTSSVGTGILPSLDAMAPAQTSRLNTVIQKGLLEGKSRAEIEASLLKTTKLTENQARTLVTTGITHAQELTTQEFWDANPDVLSGFVYTAILDGNTTRTCGSLDGTVFPADAVTHRPPLHWNCRSSLVPVLKDYDALVATDSPRVTQSALADIPPSRFNGQPPLRENFEEWLRRQPFKRQQSLLGSEDAATLFQNGTLRMNEFFTKLKRPISIGQLRTLDAKSTFSYSKDSLDAKVRVAATRPADLVRSPGLAKDLKALILADARDASQSISLTDYRGVTLGGKRSVRRATYNEYDPRNHQYDPYTGEVRSSYYYNPDYVLLTERLDVIQRSQVLSKPQREWITKFVNSLEDDVSVNQQSVIAETLRLTFERAARDTSMGWSDYAGVFRAESKFGVTNVSRILDRRSRAGDEMFTRFADVDEPAAIQILGEWKTFEDLTSNRNRNQQFIRDWDKQEGRALARRVYYGRAVDLAKGRVIDAPGAPTRAYLLGLRPKVKGPNKDIVKWVEANIPGINTFKFGALKGSNTVAGWIESVPGVKQWNSFMKEWAKPYDPILYRLKNGLSAKVRNILDLEFLKMSDRRGLVDRFITSRVLGDNEDIQVLQKVMKTIAGGTMTDYDGLAITIGKELYKQYRPLRPWYKPTLQDYHRDGAGILESLRENGTLRVMSRGVNRRGVLDLDTGRVGPPFRDTVSREVTILDKDLVQLQRANREIIVADRVGITGPSNEYHVRVGKKEYFDAYGNNTGRSVITRSAAPFYDENLIDKDFADMLNHTMSSKYQTDNDFSRFMLDLARFRDVRGRVDYYDDLNLFRHDIIKRGEQGFGLMETVKFHNARQKPFSVMARIDGRGRVYYNGYLTPTGGEMVRPFLNSAKAVPMTPGGLQQLRATIGVLTGSSTETLTDAGRYASFYKNEKSILEIGRLMQATTQRDRRIREFLEHPLIRATDGEEVAKLGRFALEYARIHDHMGGDFTDLRRLSLYETRLMSEVDASASALQMISLATGDRQAALLSNVLPTTRKQRIYDIVAQEVASDPRFLKIMEETGLDLNWEDLQKAAKYHVLVSYYGAGSTGQRARVTAELVNILKKRNVGYITRSEQLAVNRALTDNIKTATAMGAEETVDALTSFKRELNDLVKSGERPSTAMFTEAAEMHPDVFNFLDKLSRPTADPFVGPETFKDIAVLLSEKLEEQTPRASQYIKFWKKAAQRFAEETNTVDVPWVTFDGKQLWQRYRPKVQESIRFRDPVSNRFVRNVYQEAAESATLLGKGSIGDVRLGAGVNGTHMNDASIVRMFHLWGKKNGIQTGTIHDAFFVNLNHLDDSVQTLLEIYAKASQAHQIENTMLAMLKEGMTKSSYNELLATARELGLIGQTLDPNEILRIPNANESRYGFGP
jgi:SPP1 gp7 family putative phage head morphogenesis protein